MDAISQIKQRLEILWQEVQNLEGAAPSNYNLLSNKPQINGVTLEGNKTSSQLNIPDKTNYYDKEETDAEIIGAITELDVSSTPISGHYIKSIEQVDGKINATPEILDNSITPYGSKPVLSGAVYSAIQPFIPFSTPTIITSNTDLNTVRPNNQVPASYLCTTTAIAQSLSNCPTTNPFILISLPSTNNSNQKRIQIIISTYNITTTTDSIIYWRAAEDDENWSNWYLIQGTKVI